MSFDLVIVTPEGRAFHDRVDSAVLPGSEGDFGVLPGHTPLISRLRPGIVDVHNGGKVTERILSKAALPRRRPNAARCWPTPRCL